MAYIKSIENERAVKAYDFANEGAKLYAAAKSKNKSEQAVDLFENGILYKDDKYKSYIKKMPAMIQSNGLGATIAFFLSKGASAKKTKNAYDLIYKQISDWLLEKKFEHGGNLVKYIISSDSMRYRALTKETLALLAWVKRLADALIDDDAPESETELNNDNLNNGNESF